VHDKDDRGASDTTPLFLLAAGISEKLPVKLIFSTQPLKKPWSGWIIKVLPTVSLVAQQPTSDWRDEQWVIG
jgi:hypothetical protein